MATPESKAKDKVRRLLKKSGCYYFFPPANGYGSVGIPDVVGCHGGIFFGVEVKADTAVTALQQKNLDKITENGGVAFVVRIRSNGEESGLKELSDFLENIKWRTSTK